MKKKLLSLFLTLCMLVSMLPAISIPATAATDIADMDALSALGIDTRVAPEGFDANSLDNPYGKDVIDVSPVYELYTLGLSGMPGYRPKISDTSTMSAPVNGDRPAIELGTETSTSLVSSLYGHNEWNSQTAQSIINAGAQKASIGSGLMQKIGNYVEITGTEKSSTSYSQNAYLTGVKNASVTLGDNFKYALSSVASGNFDGNKSGLASQAVMVYTSEYSANGGLYLRFGDTSGYGANSIELLSTSKEIGNPRLMDADRATVPVENFAENPYQLQNYLQVATGDWNGDGVDEVAVYIPEVGNSRIVVYTLQLTSQDTGSSGINSVYSNASKWAVAWTYHFNEGNVVSNMISLVNGDVNQDGIDDLAATWGYYYGPGPGQNAGSTAVVMFGAKGNAMLQGSQQFSLNHGNSNIVRAAFAFGDMAGSGEDVLILSGQSDADLKAGKLYTRYVALFSWNGSAFTSTVNKNFDLFEKKDGDYINAAMGLSRSADKLYSLPLCVSNVAVINQGIAADGGDRLYFDSLIISYKEEGLEITEAWDNRSAMQAIPSSPVEYVEYGAVAGDLTGQTGAATVATMQQTLSSVSPSTESYAVATATQRPIYVDKYYYKNWAHKLFNIRTWYKEFSHYQVISGAQTISIDYDKFTMGNTYMVVVDPSPASPYIKREATDFSMSICLMNTDNDSSYMSYTGKHYYTYSDPEVLAVIASPPYFADLLDRDDLSGNYAESTTSYSSSTGSGSGLTTTATITAGAYIAFEQDIQVFGVTVASVEAEAVMTAGFTWDTEKTSTLEQTVTYGATSGEDMVAFYSIPLEIYEFYSHVPDGSGGYTKVTTAVNIPHEAAVRLLSLDEYEAIAADYSILPTIADNVLTHTVGNPASYPTSTNGYNVIAAYSGDPSSVGYSSTDGGSSITQEIAMSMEKSNAFTGTASIEMKAGAGAGGFTAGVVAGAEAGGGTVTISTNGSSFSGDMQNMPIEAKAYNYAMNWKIFCYKSPSGGKSFPVVSYIVSDISAPPTLPVDFEQVVSETTSDAITLAWSYDKLVAGFQLYRYYEFPDGTGSYELEYVPFTAAERYENGKYYFKYTDADLNPYSNYTYQIQTVSATRPTTSIYSEPMSCRTKTEVGYPEITISGLDSSGALPLYPDVNGSATAVVADVENYKGLSYQWQKLVGNSWTDMSGQSTRTLTISNAGTSDVTWYRCRINAIYYDKSTASEYYISAYSGSFTTAYSKRTPTYSSENGFTAEIDTENPDTLNASIKLYSANTGHSSAPTGTVTFNITGTDYISSKTEALTASSGTEMLGGLERYYSTASLNLAGLKTGVYKVSAYYGGNRVFKDMNTESKIVIVGAGEAYELNLHATPNGASVTTFTYGDNIYPDLTEITKGSGGVAEQSHISNGVTYKLNGAAFNAGDRTPSVGSYTLEAYYKEPMESVAKLVAQQSFVVTQRSATITALNQPNVSAANVTTTPPQMSAANLVDALDDIKLTYKVTNSAGNLIPLSNSTDPGNYTIIPCAGDDTSMDIYSNYNFTFVPGTYTIIGLTYKLQIIAQNYTDGAGTRSVGTAGISDVEGKSFMYTSGTAVMLYASPNAGYTVDTWTATFANNDTDSQKGGTIFHLTTEAQPVDVTVTFRPVSLTIGTAISPSAGGTIVCSDKYFASGATVYTGSEFVFTAIPAEGYHFKQWQVGTGGTSSYPAGVTKSDGSNALAIEVANSSMTVYAYFERDTYKLTLEGDIKASYDYQDDIGNTLTAEILSGASVPGDTVVKISPKAGYQPAENASYFVAGIEYTPDNDKAIEFIITEDTTVSLESVQNDYIISTSADNGTISVKIDSEPPKDDALIDVSGGSKAVFTARAARGYVFDYWEVNSVKNAEASETLTIGAVGADLAVAAVFKANTGYTAKTGASPASRGTILYTLYDIYGGLVGEEKTEMPESGIAVYQGEKITLTVQLAAGSMIEQWAGTGETGIISSKDYTISNISNNIDITVYLKASSNYRVYYAAGASGGLSATADAEAFTSSTLLGGGSKLAFTATPDSNMMVSHWTVTSGNTTAQEAAALVVGGAAFVDPIYNIDHLIGNITVRAHFTALAENTVKIPGAIAKGTAVITYVTPVVATDRGERNASASEAVRTGGTLVMTVEANSGYGTDAQTITDAIKAKVNNDAIVSVTEDSGVFNVTIKNLSNGFTLTGDDLYYALYAITVSDKITSSHSEAKHNETVTLTITPDSGYKLDTLTLSSGTLNEEVSDLTLVYTFDMPAEAVDVEVTFSQIISGGGGVIAPTVYTLTAKAGEGGKISPESMEALKGTNATFIITADEGYEISEVLVDGVSVGAVSSYTFENISKAHSISATFSAKEEELRQYTGFSDISEGTWYSDAVVYVYENWLMNGISETEFAPQAELTRSMFVTILYRMSGEEYQGEIGFTDVPDGQWYSDAVAWAVNAGVTTGYSDTEFGLNSSITREQLALMFYRFAQYMNYDTEGKNDLSEFTDADGVSSWAADAISWAVEAGLIKGSDGEISPAGNATRAEIATLIMRFALMYT